MRWAGTIYDRKIVIPSHSSFADSVSRQTRRTHNRLVIFLFVFCISPKVPPLMNKMSSRKVLSFLSAAASNSSFSPSLEGRRFFPYSFFSTASTSTSGLLHHEVVEGPPLPETSAPPLVGMVLHGLLGSGRNLRSFAQHLVAEGQQATKRPWRVLLPDLRCHGLSSSAAGRLPNSAHHQAPHAIVSAAHDVLRLIGEGRPLDFLAGHSLGGKIALSALQQSAGLAVRQTWVLDSNPKALERNADGAVSADDKALTCV
jgi:predicted alpha/beta-fold hydrolase